jgi:hypothetical protein
VKNRQQKEGHKCNTKYLQTQNTGCDAISMLHLTWYTSAPRATLSPFRMLTENFLTVTAEMLEKKYKCTRTFESLASIKNDNFSAKFS